MMMIQESQVNGATSMLDEVSELLRNYKNYYGILLIVVAVALQLITANYIQQLSLEAKRRIQHAMTGHVLVQVSYYIPNYVCIVLLCCAAVIIWYLCVYQFDVYIQHFGPLLRQNEKLQVKDGNTKIVLPGAFYFLVGTTIATILFPLHIAQYSVECLAFADPMAAYIGQTISSPKIYSGSNASFSGTIACFATAWVIGYIMLLDNNNNDKDDNGVTFTTITLGALICCFAEAIPIFGNDNLQIPILTGLVVTFIAARE
jgi:dolichol kinase